MQFRLHINDTNDGSVIAAQLRKLAGMIEGSPLNDGFTRDLAGGYATMQIEPQQYASCAEAERTLNMTLEWRKQGGEHIGYLFGRPHAKVLDWEE